LNIILAITVYWCSSEIAICKRMGGGGGGGRRIKRGKY
jgi:hypothetical protein